MSGSLESVRRSRGLRTSHRPDPAPHRCLRLLSDEKEEALLKSLISVAPLSSRCRGLSFKPCYPKPIAENASPCPTTTGSSSREPDKAKRLHDSLSIVLTTLADTDYRRDPTKQELQSGSAASTNPSQSLSIPSAQLPLAVLSTTPGLTAGSESSQSSPPQSTSR